MGASRAYPVRRMYDSGHGQSYGCGYPGPPYDDASPIVRMLLFLV